MTRQMLKVCRVLRSRKDSVWHEITVLLREPRPKRCKKRGKNLALRAGRYVYDEADLLAECIVLHSGNLTVVTL